MLMVRGYTLILAILNKTINANYDINQRYLYCLRAMIGVYTHTFIPNGTYKIYDISTNDAIQLLMTENNWTAHDFAPKYDFSEDVKQFIRKNNLDVVELKHVSEQLKPLNKGEKAVLVKYQTIYTDIHYACNYNDEGVKLLTLPSFSIIERVE